MAELRAARDRVEGADLVEMRLDTTRDPDPAAALADRRTPVIVTCRAQWEGGHFSGSEEQRRRILADALALGAEYVDVEFRAGFDDLIRSHHGRRLIVSSHDFGDMPADLVTRQRAMRATGAEVVKIAGKASCLSDCLPLLDLARHAKDDGQMVLIAMGDAGLSTRILAGRYHSAWTYAGSVRDVGQLSAEALLATYRFRTITERTAVYGLTGSPVSHSVSPAMHNAACAAAGIDAVYLPLPATSADDFLRFADAIGIRGASVTIPHKVSLFERADDVDEMTRRIGALNTLKKEGSRWSGRNTDLQGFLNPLALRGIGLRDKRVSILGAGGSARSVAIGAGSQGARVTVHARDAARALPVAALAGGVAGTWPPDADSWDVLVNCTPLGMHPNTEASPASFKGPATGLVYDLIYNPVETRLLREARAAGCQTIGGLDMLVEQAIEQFSWWTGVRPEAAPMRAAAMARLAEFGES